MRNPPALRACVGGVERCTHDLVARVLSPCLFYPYIVEWKGRRNAPFWQGKRPEKENLKKVSNFFKKGVDKRDRVWYYIRAPYETAQTKGTRREATNPDGKPVRRL